MKRGRKIIRAALAAPARVATVLASGLLVLSCAPADRHAGNVGNAARDIDPAPSLVSLNPCLDEILVEIAGHEQILALSHYSREAGGARMDIATARRFAATGGTAEEIIALAPDIVLASVFLPAPTKAALERAGLRVETFDSPRDIAESQDQIRRIADLIGGAAPARARDLARTIAMPVWPMVGAKGWDGQSDPTVLLWQAGEIVAGGDELIAQLLREEGFASHSQALGLGQGDRVTLEAVLSDPPDLLLVAGESAGQRHPVLARLAQTRVHAFDPALFYCGGPSVVAARAALSDLRQSVANGAP